ncbi:molybdopterin synthase catalytic subunit/molybdopterin synthase sulfur carrier subunit [Muriicola jejuensis]|uniref:Molybdopterin synthase sulfur carrier subunit n=1 Tax=Muriicola jejuensis TaxID=504488 RepID=A0A6P0UE42_9FLAO|nr:MoaD/ThiS family protein [Muriicola jejuensis]NER11277.1 molybdopterin synthase sulfur carrier subunit [Muriicola jejuensis]SMP21788.1 molybdopterin synthase catalytic subunit/molybdopterin synthase sulfur carrier subunit [Muriicola jejuensis]
MKILLFGITRDITGKAELELSEKTASALRNVKDLREFIIGEYPELKSLSSMAIAVNNEYATGETGIGQEDEIALIPPVSGG